MKQILPLPLSFSFKRAALAVAALALSLPFGADAFAQSAVFAPISSAADSGARAEQLKSLSQAPTTADLKLVRVNVDALKDAQAVFSLEGKGDVVVDQTKTVTRSANDATYFGKVAGGEATLVIQDGEVTGLIQTDTILYKVIPVGGGAHAVVRVDTGKFPTEHPPAPQIKLNSADTAVPSGDVIETADGIQVDVLVAWTVNARNAYGGNMAAWAQLAVDSANTSYTASNANVSMRLAGTIEITYSETGKSFDTVLDDLLAGTNAQMAAVKSKRDQVGADMVGLMINLTEYCGLAADIASSSANAYMAMYWDCVSNYSFQHEFGHLFGARHDPYVDSTNTPFPYGHGYIGASGSSGWRTVMAYVNGCNGCPRKNFFSNPSKTFNGAPTGTSSTHDNARVHRERVATVASWKNAPPTVYTGPRASHDFNGDLRSDILWRANNGDIQMWMMAGPNVIGSASLGNIPTSWNIVGQRDFNGTIHSDVLWADSSSNIYAWLMSGANVAGVVYLGNAGNWAAVGTGDFNADGVADILWRSPTGDTYLSLVNNNAISMTISLGNVPNNWFVNAVADFNGDGRVDILWRDSTGTLVIWFMNGGAVTSVSNLGNVSMAFAIVATADFNADGRADILWRSNTGNVSMWLMNGATVVGTGSYGSLPANWTVSMTGDFNGDGRGDILWRDNSAGTVAVWQMVGTTLGYVGTIGTVPTNWTVQALNAN